MLDQIDDAGRKDRHHQRDEQRRAERGHLLLEHFRQRRHGRGIAGEFQQPQQTDHPQEAQIDLDQEGHIEGQNGNQIDQRGGADHIAQTADDRLLVIGIFNTAIDAEQIFDTENAHRDHIENMEFTGQHIVHIGNTFQHHRHHRQENHPAHENIEHRMQLARMHIRIHGGIDMLAEGAALVETDKICPDRPDKPHQLGEPEQPHQPQKAQIDQTAETDEKRQDHHQIQQGHRGDGIAQGRKPLVDQ